ncbi:MAG: HIT family protein [Anaeroplasmataceae bacterium]|nr:HIT family protein [Anaeroplasmataceae bacterium]
MKKENCPYCNYGEPLAKFGLLAFETTTSEVIVFKDQTHKGRMVVAYKKDHVAEIQDLNEKDRNAFMKDVADVAKAIQKAYHPDRINYGAYGDTLGHLHFHLCPKYEGEAEWGGTFVMNTGNLSDDEVCKEVARKIIENYEA